MAAPRTKRSKNASTKKAADPKVSLPAPRDLERICKGLAALDAMMSELVKRLTTDRTLADLKHDLAEIAY